MTVRPTRILLVAPSLDIVGGQSVQASRLLELLQHSPDVQVEFLPINPRLPGPLRQLQKVKYLRTVLTSGTFLCQLLLKAGRFDILHSFSAANYSFLLSTAPVVVVGRGVVSARLARYVIFKLNPMRRAWVPMLKPSPAQLAA